MVAAAAAAPNASVPMELRSRMYLQRKSAAIKHYCGSTSASTLRAVQTLSTRCAWRCANAEWLRR